MIVCEILNGNLIDPGSSFLNGDNRSYRFGDGIFETIKVYNATPLFLKEHLNRLQRGLHVLSGIENHLETLTNIENNLIQVLQEKNLTSGRVRLTVYRDGTGFYTPDQNTLSWHLSISEDNNHGYKILRSGISACIYTDNFKSPGTLSPFKTTSSLLYVMACLKALNNSIDESLILNCFGNIIETGTSNIFIYKEGKFSTPPLTDGCIDGIMSGKLKEIILKEGYVLEERSITMDDLLFSQEILISNVIKGISWIRQVNNTTYANLHSERFNRILSDEIK